MVGPGVADATSAELAAVDLAPEVALIFVLDAVSNQGQR
jgi:hypothetical protein